MLGERLNTLPRIPMCSPRVFPIAPCCNLICFAQSPPLLTYIGGSKGGGTPSFHKIFYFGSVHSFNLFFAMGQSSCVIAKKESWTCERLIGTPVLKKGYIFQGEKEQFHETNRKAQLTPMNVQFFSF